MNSQKTLQVIENVKNMTDREADILEIFITGFRVGMKTGKDEIQKQLRTPPTDCVVQHTSGKADKAVK